MTNSRRDFLKKSAMAVVAASVPIELSNVALAQHVGVDSQYTLPLESQRDPLMYLKESSFEPYVNSIFQVSASNSAITAELELVKVVSLTTVVRSAKAKVASTTIVRSTAREEPFSLLFRSNRETLPQNVYDVDHAALGEFRLLLVPTVHRDSSAHYYEAVINRSV